jgi:DNA polymerase zeta
MLQLMQVRFIVVHGQPGARLVDCVVHPQAILAAGGRLQLNGQYYITKQLIPALDRLFSLLGVDVSAWYTNMTKPLRLLPQKRPLASLPMRMLSLFFPWLDVHFLGIASLSA